MEETIVKQIEDNFTVIETPNVSVASDEPFVEEDTIQQNTNQPITEQDKDCSTASQPITVENTDSGTSCQPITAQNTDKPSTNEQIKEDDEPDNRDEPINFQQLEKYTDFTISVKSTKKGKFYCALNFEYICTCTK